MEEAILQHLQLPEKSLVKHKITKAFFRRNFTLSNAEKKRLDDPALISQMNWLACISLLNNHVQPYADEQYTYEEIQIISVQTNPEVLTSQPEKIVDLIQRHLPYHVLLILHDGNACSLHAATKRIHQTDAQKRIVEQSYATALIPIPAQRPEHRSFLESLAFNRLNSHDLRTLYLGYVQCIVALQRAEINGQFMLRPRERTMDDVQLLEAIATTEKEIQLLYKRASQAIHLQQRITLNTELQQKRTQLETLKQQLSNA